MYTASETVLFSSKKINVQTIMSPTFCGAINVNPLRNVTATLFLATTHLSPTRKSVCLSQQCNSWAPSARWWGDPPTPTDSRPLLLSFIQGHLRLQTSFSYRVFPNSSCKLQDIVPWVERNVSHHYKPWFSASMWCLLYNIIKYILTLKRGV